MNRRRARSAVVVGALLTAGAVAASPRLPAPDFAFDGGVFSAETLGRGGTIASNRGTPASGSENPAALVQKADNPSLYATTLLDVRSQLPRAVKNGTDPLDGRLLQYLSVNADKGVLFYEPLSRFSQRQILDTTTGQYQDVDVSANALGFAGAAKLGDGSFGLSIAYLWAAETLTENSGTALTDVRHGTMDGVRMNLGVRYPTGPAMWGLLVQNAPGFLWGNEFRREQLPMKIRVGNTYRLAKGVLLSIDGERRFYGEGSRPDNLLYVGNETFIGDRLVARVGVFGTNVNRPDERHATAGLTFSATNGTAISYAFESFRLDEQKVNRSLLSVQMPFVGGGD